MNHTPFRHEHEPSPSSPSSGPSGQAALGTILLFTGAAIPLLAFIERAAGLPFEMPRSWHSMPLLWYLIAFLCFFSGMRLLKSAPVEHRRWEPEVPGRRFDQVVIYAKEECHLCHQAKDVLYAHGQWLPEIEEVDITTSPVLMEKFGEQIPVVEIDGQIRFRGQVNPILLRRLIDATNPK
jgi:glutaredoxin